MPLSKDQEIRLRILELEKEKAAASAPAAKEKPTAYEPSELETYSHSLAPKGLVSSLYGASEAIQAPWGKKMDTYRRERDRGKSYLTESEELNPKSAMSGNLTRGLLAGVATGGSIPGLMAVGGLESAVNSDADLTRLDDERNRKQFGQDVGVGMAGAGALGAASEVIPSALSSKLRGTAEKLAEKATGATRTMAEKFKPGSGRELLNRKIVRFGDSPAKVSERATEALNTSGKGISNSLKKLEESGVRIEKDDIITGLKEKIDGLKSDESKSGVVRKLEKILQDAESMPEERLLTDVENVKRGFQSQSNYNKPLTTEANKLAAKVYQKSVEDATLHNPKITKQFLDDKKTYGLLRPIQEASEKRAMQLNQSPIGGLLDVASFGAGYAGGDERTGAGALIARRLLSPRAASSAAVTTEQLAKLLEKLPPKARAAIVGSIAAESSR